MPNHSASIVNYLTTIICSRSHTTRCFYKCGKHSIIHYRCYICKKYSSRILFTYKCSDCGGQFCISHFVEHHYVNIMGNMLFEKNACLLSDLVIEHGICNNLTNESLNVMIKHIKSTSLHLKYEKRNIDTVSHCISHNSNITELDISYQISNNDKYYPIPILLALQTNKSIRTLSKQVIQY